VKKASERPFWFERVAVSCDYEAVPRVATIRGRTPIERSRRGHSRPIHARLTLEQLIDLEYQIHLTILAIKDGVT
jgi:hypothetical protein